MNRYRSLPGEEHVKSLKPESGLRFSYAYLYPTDCYLHAREKDIHDVNIAMSHGGDIFFGVDNGQCHAPDQDSRRGSDAISPR